MKPAAIVNSLLETDDFDPQAELDKYIRDKNYSERLQLLIWCAENKGATCDVHEHDGYASVGIYHAGNKIAHVFMNSMHGVNSSKVHTTCKLGRTIFKDYRKRVMLLK